MKLRREIKRHLLTTVSAVFIVQLLVSSFCFVTPASAMETMASNHCHEQMMQMDTNHHTDMMHDGSAHQWGHQPVHPSGSACSHCDLPQNATTASHAIDLTPAPMLLAVLTSYIDSFAAVTDKSFRLEKAQAPPDSSDLLLTTTQRIRI